MKIPEETVAAVMRLYRLGWTRPRIAVALNLKWHTVKWVIASHRPPDSFQWKVYLPSEQEIADATAKLRGKYERATTGRCKIYHFDKQNCRFTAVG